MNQFIITGSIALLITASAIAGAPNVAPAREQEPAKANPLSFADGLLTLDIEARARFEARSNNRDFDDRINDDNDDTWAVTRLRIGLAVKPAPWLKLYAQVQDTREFDSDRPNTPGLRGNEGDDHFDLRQAYVELGDLKSFPLSLTLGRQALSYGDRRVLADSQWANFGRTFDAAKLRWQPAKGWMLDAFAGRPVQIKEDTFNDSDSADNLFGLYLTTEALGFQTTEFYALHRDKSDDQPDLDPVNKLDAHGAGSGPAQRTTTIGTRWKSTPGALGNWDYTAEFAYQFGDLWTGNRTTAKLDHRAFATHTNVGYTFADAQWKPRLALEYNYATGDKNPGDGRSQSFQNLFASNHEKYGFIDEFSWRNLHDVRLSLSAKPAKNVDVTLDYHAFWLAETTDYWFRANGTSTLRTKTPAGRDVRSVGASNFAGDEVDVTVKWKATDHLTVECGYSHFFAGSYLKDTGPGDDADFAYVQATIAF